MVLEYFKLAEQPFGVTPNPRYLFFSPTHREALASIYYGVTSGRGFTALIAAPGMGKTTLLFDFLSKTTHSTKTVFLFQAQPTPRDLLRNLLEDIGVQPESDDMGHMQRKLNEILIQEFNQGKQLIVVIDEAQNLDEDVLEVVRMLSNFETPRQKLMHLILAGQPALAERLASPRLLQLRQRISIVAQLKRFDAANTKLYIDHRLRVAGYQGKTSFFTKQALEMIAHHSGGIPRNINTLCFNALSLACALKSPSINSEVMDEVIADLDLSSLYQFTPETAHSQTIAAEHLKPAKAANYRSRTGWWLKAALAICLITLLLGILFRANLSSLHLPAALDLSKLAITSSATTAPSAPPAPVSQSNSTAQQAAALADSNENPVETTSPVSQPLASPEKQESQQEPDQSHVAPRTSQAHFITVQKRDSIFQICVDNLGKYDAASLAKIRELNPDIRDLRRLKIGQKIRIPLNEPSSRSPGQTVAQEVSSAGATVGKHE